VEQDTEKVVSSLLSSGDCEKLVRYLRELSADDPLEFDKMASSSGGRIAERLMPLLEKEETFDCAVLLLSRISSVNDEALASVIALLDDEKTQFQAGAAGVLSEFCNRKPSDHCRNRYGQAKSVLGKLMRVTKNNKQPEPFKDKRRWSRVKAVEAIGEMNIPEAIPFLVELLGDGDPMVVFRARAALSKHKEKEVIDAMQEILKKEKSDSQILGALWILDRLANQYSRGESEDLRRVIPALLELFERQLDERVHSRIVRLLLRIDEKEGVLALESLLTKDAGKRTAKLHETAVSYLGRLAENGNEEALNALKRFVENSSEAGNVSSNVYEEARFVLEVIESSKNA